MKIRVAVLRGGPSSGYEDSLKSGAYILSHLRDMQEEYEPVDVFISRDGEWHYSGLPSDPHSILSRSDVVWNTMRGDYGEDGQVQKILENLHVPFVGSGALASGIAHNKGLTKEIYLKHSLPTPRFIVLSPEDLDDNAKFLYVYRNFMHPVVVKPVNGIRGMGIKLVRTLSEAKDAVKKVFEHSPKAMIEEYISGASLHCAVLEGGKGEDLYAFLPTHIRTKRNIAKPSIEDNRKVVEMAKKAHEILGLGHFSNSDFVITPKGKIYILETNSVPMLFENSMLHQSLEETGWHPKDFITHTIKMAQSS